MVIAQEAIIKSKSSSKVPDFFKDALSIPNISAHSLLTEMISKAFSIALILDRFPVIFFDFYAPKYNSINVMTHIFIGSSK